jgi:hypothetical protein
MKIYKLYEFPPTKVQLINFLLRVEKIQPITKEIAMDIAHAMYGKRSSRSEITVRNLMQLGLLMGRTKISLSMESQLYLDIGKDIADLLLHLVYNIPSLFNVCEDICNLDPKMELDNPSLLELLYSNGYQKEKISTAREKIYAIKRLIVSCEKEGICNSFIEYKKYREFLGNLQNCYLMLVNDKIGEVIEINTLRDELITRLETSSEFDINIKRLYHDVLLVNNVSFTGVNSDFARRKYYTIGNNDFYYIKFISKIDGEKLV